jgi:hypothetical protein
MCFMIDRWRALRSIEDAGPHYNIPEGSAGRNETFEMTKPGDVRSVQDAIGTGKEDLQLKVKRSIQSANCK